MPLGAFWEYCGFSLETLLELTRLKITLGWRLWPAIGMQLTLSGLSSSHSSMSWCDHESTQKRSFNFIPPFSQNLAGAGWPNHHQRWAKPTTSRRSVVAVAEIGRASCRERV